MAYESETSPQDDLTLTIHIHRPSEDEPDGCVSLTATAETPDGQRVEAGATGRHDDTTMKRVLLDVHSYLEHGRKSWVNLTADSRSRVRER